MSVRLPVELEEIRRTRRGPKLREATVEDYVQIASLEDRYGLAVKPYEEWTHLHLENPLQSQLQTPCPIGWVIEDEHKQIVGSVGNIPLAYELEGRPVLAVTGRGLVTEPAYRSASLLLLDRLIDQDGLGLFLTNAITPASAAGFKALGCQRVPVGRWDQSGFWITGCRSFSRSLLSMKQFALAGALSYPLAAATFLKDRLGARQLRDGDVEVQFCQAFDDRFDDFWEDLKRRNPHLLLAVRSREMLGWHFKYALLRKHLWIATIVDGLRLAAYAIFDRRDNTAFGLKRMRLVDFQPPDATGTLLAPLLSHAVRRCRHEGIHMLESVGLWMDKGDLIDQAAPHRRRLSTWTYVYRADSPALADNLKDTRVWFPSLFDASASL